MRASISLAGASLFLAASLSLAVPEAHADEMLVMPYACSMVGGRPLLTPAPEQGHRIVGQREQRTHTACSPVNPEQCRNWTLHRFMLDCEGSRVPWVSVVASVAEETTRRAWVENGRLVLRMPSSWSFEPGDPCARPPGFDERFGFGRMRRYCADRRAMAPPIVEMPAGFAPLLGIEGIFVKSSGPNTSPTPPLPPPVASTPPTPPPRVARAEPPQPPVRAEPAPLPATRPEPPSDPVAKNAPAQSPPPPKVAVQASPQAPAAPAAKAPPPSAPESASPPAAPGGPVVPKIINRPESATADMAEQKRPTPMVPKAVPPTTEIPKSTGNPIPSNDSSREIPPPSASIGRDDTSITVSLLSIVRSPTIGLVAFGGLALVLLAVFALARRRERLAGTPHPRDIASVSLDSRRGRGSLIPRPGPAPPRRTTAVAPSPSPPPLPVASPPAQRTPAAWVERIPQTRVEALQMLGVGVSPDATETAMKKIVDGLRLSWHPDLAKDETDRQLREFRLKQINAAWDLIQGKRLERLDS